jgi:hypothetical protein
MKVYGTISAITASARQAILICLLLIISVIIFISTDLHNVPLVERLLAYIVGSAAIVHSFVYTTRFSRLLLFASGVILFLAILMMSYLNPALN